jgi:nucleoid-associated protein YgaU
MDRNTAATKPSLRDQKPAAQAGQPEAKESKAETATATPATAILAEHTVVSGDNLSAIANKYYGSAARDKWMAIYEANKAIIGDNPSLIRPGQKLAIPKLG